MFLWRRRSRWEVGWLCLEVALEGVGAGGGEAGEGLAEEM